MPKQPKSFNLPASAFGSFNFQTLDQSSGPPELAIKAFDWNQKVLIFTLPLLFSSFTRVFVGRDVLQPRRLGRRGELAPKGT